MLPANNSAIRTRPKLEPKTIVAKEYEDRKTFVKDGVDKKENRYTSWKAEKDRDRTQFRTILHTQNPKMSCAGASDQGASGTNNLLVKRGGDDDEEGWYCRGPRQTNALSLRQKYLKWKHDVPRKAGTTTTTVRKPDGTPLRDKNNKIIKRKTRTSTFIDYVRENPGATRAFGPANQ